MLRLHFSDHASDRMGTIIPLCAVTFSWWGIAYLIDPDSYAGWIFDTPVKATQARQVEG